MMRSSLCRFLFLAATVASTSASIFLPGQARSLVDLGRSGSSTTSGDTAFHRRRSYQRALQKQQLHSPSSHDGVLRHPLAMAIPGNSLAEQVVIGGFGNFISIYNTVITARILLTWFPQSQGIGFLQPIFQITDPYLNLFRGIIPPIFGLDLSPILAFVTLNLLQSSAVSLAAEIPGDMRKKLEGKKGQFGMAVGRGRESALLAHV